MDWTEKKRQEAEKTLIKIAAFLARDPLTKAWVSTSGPIKPPNEFVDALSNDLNTSLALTLLVKYLKDEREIDLIGALELIGFDRHELVKRFSSFRSIAMADEAGRGSQTQVYGDNPTLKKTDLSTYADRLHTLRTTAMETKDFAPVDALKTALLEAGVEVRMSKTGVELDAGPNFDPSKLEGLL